MTFVSTYCVIFTNEISLTFQECKMLLPAIIWKADVYALNHSVK